MTVVIKLIKDRVKITLKYYKQKLVNLDKTLIRPVVTYASETVSYTHLDVYKRQVLKLLKS